ncbi:hypothetical protein OSI34_05540, partial [Mycobacterium ulcerans]
MSRSSIPCTSRKFVTPAPPNSGSSMAASMTASAGDCRGKGVSGLIGPGVSGPERSHDDQDC